MKTLNQFLDEYAVLAGFYNYMDYCSVLSLSNHEWCIICKKYATQVAEVALTAAFENATANVVYHDEDQGEPSAEIDKDSILNTAIVTP